jgi:hypothetical protein
MYLIVHDNFNKLSWGYTPAVLILQDQLSLIYNECRLRHWYLA